MRIRHHRALRALLLCAFMPHALVACMGSSGDAVELQPGKWTGQSFPSDGRADVRSYYERIEQAVATGGTVTLPTLRVDSFLGADDFGEPQDLELRLVRSRLLDPGAFFEVNGIPQPGPFMRTYEGHVEGEPNQLAHVLVAKNFIRGAVRVGDNMNVIRIAMKGNRPLDMERRPVPPDAQPVDRPRSGDPSACPDDGIPANAGLRAVPPYLSPVNGLGLGDAPELRARVILDADYKASERWKDFVPAMMVGMTIEMDLAFRYEVGIRHTIVGLHQNLIKDYYPDPEARDPFAQMGRWWDGHHAAERDIVHLFTGYDSSYAQANCIGSTGTPAGYSFTSVGWEEQYAYFHRNAYAHEFGHLYSAHHHYGNHVESDLATLMIQGYTPGSQPQFSSLSRAVIRGWGEHYLQPWQ